jgi:hypothetical protein
VAPLESLATSSSNCLESIDYPFLNEAHAHE